ncbi:transcription initiation factor TFIID subunit 2 [Nematocida parisii]|nr:transcription initiation factor TFIID subunit 2 [Nematocida parisii]
MNVTHQKNILHLSTGERRCTGTSIFHVNLQKEERLEILQIQLKILKVEIFSENMWKIVEMGDGVKVPSTTEKIRVLFETEKNNPSITFYSTPNRKCVEFAGEPINGHAQGMFPILSNNEFSMEMVYIVSFERGFQVVSSGTLSGIYDGGTTKTFHYKIDSGRPRDILFAGGMYEEMQSGRVTIYIPKALSDRFAAGGKESLEVLKSSISAAQQALDYKLPFYKLYVVFSMCSVAGSIGRNCAIFNISQIIVPEAIDQCFSSIKLLTKIVAEQYFGVHAYAISEQDYWMYTGLSEYVSMYLIEMFLGVNEAKYELNRNIDYIHKNDIEEPPLSSVDRARNTFKSPFFIKKSGAFIKILENNLTRAFMQKIMKEVLEARTIGTQDLIRVVKGITGKDVRMLFEAYVYRTGIPTVIAQVEQNSRAGGFSIILKQKIHSVHPEANRHITGNICVRVYETDSVLDHVLFIGSTPITHELACNQRSQRRKQKGEESASLLWIRIDPGLEWMKVSVVEQADYMFAEQLVSEKDVYGQMEALAGVQKNPSETICGILERVMGDAQMFYKVSVAAGILLAKSVNEESGYFGFQRVVQYFINSHCIQNTTIVKTNDFSQYRTYFMQKNIASSMSLCQLDSTKSLSGRIIRAKNVVSAFLLNLMRYNDNTGNQFEDSFYIADIITSLSIALCSDAYLDTGPFVMEIERLRKKDLLFPSHQNIVTCATIKAFTRLSIQGCITVSFKGILRYTLPENFYKVRMAAYESLILLHPDQLKLIIEMAESEERLVRIKILKTIKDAAMCAALPIFEKIRAHVTQIQEIGRMFAGDEEIDCLVEEIEGLLMEPTELVADVVEEAILHDMSSDDEVKTLPKLIIKLFKPLTIKIPLKDVPEEVRKEVDAPVPIVEEAVQPPPEIDVDALYENDTHRAIYCLDKPQKIAACHLLDHIKKSKASMHISQLSKKTDPQQKKRIPTFDDITIEINHKKSTADEPHALTEEANSAPREDASSVPAPESSIENISDGSVVEIKISNEEANTHLKNEVRCLFNQSDDYRMSNIYAMAAHIFREYFKSAQYDTSSYCTIKYFQAYFEREYAAFFHMTQHEFGLIDSECKDRKGRDILVEMVEKVIEADRHKIFSSPIDIDLLREYKYLEIVRRPLDLQMIKKRLEENEYFMVECVMFDIIQVFVNCLTYNLVDSDIYKEALFVRKEATKIIQDYSAEFPHKCMLKDALFAVIAEIMQAEELAVFFEKVDKEQYPQYYSIVKEPMTLSLIKTRAQSNYYRNIMHFESDFQRISTATLLYNGPASEITKLGKALINKVQNLVQKVFPWYRSMFNKRTTIQQKTKAPAGTSKKIKSQK